MATVFWAILLVLSWAFIAGLNKEHRDKTGVDMPSRGAMRRIRRNARRAGQKEVHAYEQWVARKQKLAHVAPMPSFMQNAKFAVPEVKLSAIRPPPHEPFDFYSLQTMAAACGLNVKKQAFSLYYILDHNGEMIVNPYADAGAINTDFNKRDLEDFLISSKTA